ncbi:SAF domain-containing protein [Streptomyces sp. ODS28]|uniref:SAF domain-containing protein n=1 Tax=Streptomyces sp. ODS28 TaxID=3136688 RepID=UPI0031ED3251
MTGAPRRRRVPYLLVGGLLVLGCAAGGVVVASQLGQRESVLVLNRPVSVGQRLEAGDVREASISRDGDLAALPVRFREAVVGRPVAYSLPSGALLTKSVLGPAAVPPAGMAVAAVGLKTGQFPTGLKAGNRVRVVAAPQEAEPGAKQREEPASTWEATVTDLQRPPDEQLTAVTLQLADADAEELAAAPDGALRLVIVHGGAR